MRKTAVTSLLGILLLFFVWSAFQLKAEQPLPQANKPLELYSNTNNTTIKKTVLAAIAEAKKSIVLIVYALNDKQVIDLLKEKASQGINVKVIVDAKASAQAYKKLGDKIQILKRSAIGLMHLKILVVDDEACYIGSANMTTDSLRMHGNLMLGLRSSDIANMILNKSMLMPKEGESPKVLHKTFLLANQQVELWFLPDDREALGHLIHLIDEAKKSLSIAMFTWTHPKLAQAVINAHQRGLKVEVVIDYNSGKGAGAEIVKKLKDAGVALRLSQGPALLHYKMLYIDENILVNGSANWTRSAFTKNDDCFIVLYNLTQQQQATMNNLWKVIWNEGKPL